MYLKKLEISGFKSFANKTTLTFMPDDQPAAAVLGITAIVGPNGSGKSNVADAIRFALGEQSSKNLRGKKSEDVIFAGTDKKARLGAASVTLFFDNTDKRIPLEFEEVAVTRKVYRSGEGEYLINGSRVRLMDVVDLLAKAGVGQDSYAVITQGMSDAVLRASVEDRRRLIEDAAGVKQYQIEKRRAKRRLMTAEENLRQVDSLLLEIGPHLKNLRRQAERASQGKELAQKLHQKQTLLYGFLWHEFQSERGSVTEEKEMVEQKVTALEKEAKILEQKVQDLGQVMQDVSQEEVLRTQREQALNECNRSLQERNMLLGKVELEEERQKPEEVVRVIPVDLGYVEKELLALEEIQKTLVESLQAVKTLEELAGIRERATELVMRLAQLRTKAKQGSVTEKTLITLPEPEMLASQTKVKEFQVQIERLSQSEQKAQRIFEKAEKELAELRAKTTTAREEFFVEEKKWRECERELMQTKDRLNDIRVRLARVEVREEDLVSLTTEELNQHPEKLVYAGEDVVREQLEREIARLKVEVEHVGSIDPLVVEEYQETEERYIFLEKEALDLREASARLLEVIDEMDVKIDEAFHEAFKEIRKKFLEYFSLIFGGGKADLTLEKIAVRKKKQDEDELDEEESEEAEGSMGIEIFACPPGKKITSLAMLSGGERSLTSLALLFAIIAYNPPPFAVLDEVEAALDEANSQRFGRVLKDLSKNTQFVAITHNRETMSQASLIYGVTMGGDGISQLLSVRLDEALEQSGE